jgi:hypothetical protein
MADASKMLQKDSFLAHFFQGISEVERQYHQKTQVPHKAGSLRCQSVRYTHQRAGNGQHPVH